MAIMPEYWMIRLECGHQIRTWKTVEREESALYLGASIPCDQCGPGFQDRKILAIVVTCVELVPSTRPAYPPPPEAPPRRLAKGWRQIRLPISEELLLYV